MKSPRKKAAGARKPPVTGCFRHRPVSADGGAPLVGGSAVTLAPLTALLAEGLRGRVLHLLRDPVDVVRVAQEVLEELEQALADRPAELGRLEVGEIEPEGLCLRERTGRRLRNRIRVHGGVEILVQGGEAAPLS